MKTPEETREETAAEFAAAMNAQVYAGDDVIANAGRMDLPDFTLPPADAPLHEHLAFVGHVAEAMPEGVRLHDISRRYVGWDDWGWRVVFYAASDIEAEAPDLSHAAMLAAIKATGGRTRLKEQTRELVPVDGPDGNKLHRPPAVRVPTPEEIAAMSPEQVASETARLKRECGAVGGVSRCGPAPACARCGGSGWDRTLRYDGGGMKGEEFAPCPDCQRKPTPACVMCGGRRIVPRICLGTGLVGEDPCPKCRWKPATAPATACARCGGSGEIDDPVTINPACGGYVESSSPCPECRGKLVHNEERT